MRSMVSFFSFYGRTRRRVYGGFCLGTVAVFIILSTAVLFAALKIYGKKIFGGGTPADTRALEFISAFPQQLVVWISIVSGVVWVVMFVAWFPLTVRRLHDMGGTGWIIMAFIPLAILLSLIGYLLFCLVLSVWPGTRGANHYGRDPRQPDDIAQVFADPVERLRL